VVLLILAGITINYIIGDHSVFKQVQNANVYTKLSKIEEQAGIIYSSLLMQKQKGEIDNINNRNIIDKLIENGTEIEIRKIGVNEITEIRAEPAQISLDENESVTVKILFDGSDNGYLYYAKVDEKYYKIRFNGSMLVIERNSTKLEGSSTETLRLEIEEGYDATIIKEIKINENENTIFLTRGSGEGSTTLFVKYGIHNTIIKVEEKETDWAWMNSVAKAIANDKNITKDSNEANGKTEKGEEYHIKVGDIFKVKYNGEIRQVRVLGFKHDNLVNQNIYGGNHKKAGISFEFYDFMLGKETRQMNSSATTLGGWGKTQLRKELNGYNDTNDIQNVSIGGLGLNLSNNQYIKQVEKQYIKIWNDGNSNNNYSYDYLWLLASSEIYSSGEGYGYAITTEGNQYQFYRERNPIHTHPSECVQRRNSSSGSSWWLRSPLTPKGVATYGNDFCTTSRLW